MRSRIVDAGFESDADQSNQTQMGLQNQNLLGNAAILEHMRSANQKGGNQNEQQRLKTAKEMPVSTRGGFTARLLAAAGSSQTLGNILKHDHIDERPVTKAVASAIVCRVLNLDTSIAGAQPYFQDVDASQWYHAYAYTTHRYGILTAGKKKNFKPSEVLTDGQAMQVIERARNVQEPSNQPQAEPKPVVEQAMDSLVALKKGNSDFQDIAKAREEVKELPKEMKADQYRKIAASVMYRNQRDNAGKNVTPDNMCNMTSIAMALNQLGIGSNEKNAQYEDQIDAQLLKDTGSNESRFTPSVRANWLKNKFDLKVQQLTPQTGSAQAAKKWFHEKVLPHFELGASATMGTPDRSTGLQYNHIVRVQWVEEEGIRVDDPFGKATKQGSQYKYNGHGNAKNTSEGSGAQGENNLWTWEMLAKTHPSYIQIYNTKGKH